MAKSTIFLDLPTEIHRLITDCLDFPNLMQLKMVCRYFHELIPRLNIDQLLAVEVSQFGIQKDLYACRDCLRLRPRARFADRMVKRKRARFAAEAGKRFCVDCGIHPRDGTSRYTRGSLITVQGERYVICRRCGAFSDAVVEIGKSMSECKKCRSYSRAIERHVEERRESQERATLRAEQAVRRARRRELWGSDYEYTEDEIPPSPTWSEIEMDMIQSEADAYMNSPKAGSD